MLSLEFKSHNITTFICIWHARKRYTDLVWSSDENLALINDFFRSLNTETSFADICALKAKRSFQYFILRAL